MNNCKSNKVNKISPVLFEKKEECSGCGACSFVCPRGAITMVIDDEWFRYPSIDVKKCIGCNRCVKVCCFTVK